MFFTSMGPADRNPDDSDVELPRKRWGSFHAAVEKFPEEYRAVFKLAWYLGMTQTATADALGWFCGSSIVLAIFRFPVIRAPVGDAGDSGKGPLTGLVKEPQRRIQSTAFRLLRRPWGPKSSSSDGVPEIPVRRNLHLLAGGARSHGGAVCNDLGSAGGDFR